MSGPARRGAVEVEGALTRGGSCHRDFLLHRLLGRLLLELELLVGIGGRRSALVGAFPRAQRGDRNQLSLQGPELGQRHLACLHADDLVDALGRGRAVLPQRLLQALERRAQLELAKGLAQARAVGLARDHPVEVDLHVHVAYRGGQLLGDARVVGVLGQVLLALGPGDRLDVGQHALQVPPLLEQLRRGLVADAGNPGDVVRGVALEPHEVRDQLGRDAVAVDHRFAVVDLGVGDPAPGGHHAHARLDQLKEIAVAGEHGHVDALLARLAGQRGDHVVGLVARHLHVLVAEGIDQRVHVRPLLGQQVGLLLAVPLVLLVDLLAPRHARVPDHQRRLEAELGDHLHEHRRKAEDGVGGLSLRRGDRLRERKKGAVDEAVPVDQDELAGGLAGHGLTVPTRPRTARA